MSFELTGLLTTQIGFGGGIGFVIGYATKKMLILLLIVVGLFFALLQLLAYQGFITINWEKFQITLSNLADKLPEYAVENPLPDFLFIGLPFGASFAVGLLVGLKIG